MWRVLRVPSESSRDVALCQLTPGPTPAFIILQTKKKPVMVW